MLSVAMGIRIILSLVLHSVIMGVGIVPSVIIVIVIVRFAECYYEKCRCGISHYAECFA
jgi:hypothetical protein